jgi:hypothetical protein
MKDRYSRQTEQRRLKHLRRKGDMSFIDDDTKPVLWRFGPMARDKEGIPLPSNMYKFLFYSFSDFL